MRWPFMTKARHEREAQIVIDLAESAVRREYDRARKEGRTLVHAWAREVTWNIYHENNPTVAKSKALAAFQQAETIFRPEPITAKEVLANATATA